MRNTLYFPIIWICILSLAVCSVIGAIDEPEESQTTTQAGNHALVRPKGKIVPRRKPNEGLVYPPLNRPQPPVPKRTELGNGMIVYLLEDHEFPIIDVSVQIRTGSIYEPGNRVGLAEITGAVMRTGGTTSKTGDELDEILENLAAAVEVVIGPNSGTASMSVLKEDLDIGLSVLADVLMNPAFRKDKIELEKVQHRSAIARRNDDAGSISSREFQKLIYGASSPYARMTEYDTINSITRDDLVAFHQTYFRPNNMIWGVLGDFDSAEILAKIGEAFKHWKPSEIDLPEKPPLPEQITKTLALVTKNDVNQTTIRMGHLGWLRKNEDYPALVVACQILGIGFSSRLVNSIRVKKGLAYTVGNNYGAGYEVPGVFLITCGTKSESTVTATESILAEVEKIRNEEVSTAELKQAVDGFMNSSVFDYDTKGEILSRALRYEYYGYPQDFVQQLMDRIRNVTKADVKRVAAEHLVPDQFTILAVGKAADFDKPLKSLGRVTEIDITIPKASHEPIPKAVDADISRAREIIDDVIDAHGGLDNLRQVKTLVSSGKMILSMSGQLIETNRRATIAFPAKTRFDMTIEPMGVKMSRVFDGESLWLVTPQGIQLFPESFAEEARKQAFRENTHLLTHISNVDISVQHLGEIQLGGKMTDIILASNTPADSFKLFIDQETSRIVKKEFQALGEDTTVHREEILTDYREVSGLKIPFHTVTLDNGQKTSEITLNEVLINTDVDESIFKQ